MTASNGPPRSLSWLRPTASTDRARPPRIAATAAASWTVTSSTTPPPTRVVYRHPANRREAAPRGARGPRGQYQQPACTTTDRPVGGRCRKVVVGRRHHAGRPAGHRPFAAAAWLHRIAWSAPGSSPPTTGRSRRRRPRGSPGRGAAPGVEHARGRVGAGDDGAALVAVHADVEVLGEDQRRSRRRAAAAWPAGSSRRCVAVPRAPCAVRDPPGAVDGHPVVGRRAGPRPSPATRRCGAATGPERQRHARRARSSSSRPAPCRSAACEPSG